MGDWKVIVPESTVNKVLNPSAESTGSYGPIGGATVSRPTTYSAFGLRSYRLETTGDNQGMTGTLETLGSTGTYATMRVRGALPDGWDWSLDNVNYTDPTLLESIDPYWSLYGALFPAVQANGSTALWILQNGAGAGDFYIDGLQVEQKDHWTTYCDGTQKGCEWRTIEQASASLRSAQSRAGGRVYDLQDDYSLDIGGMMGVGTPPQSVRVDEYTILPGGELSGIKVHPRPFTLTGVIRGSSFSDLHSKRQTLISILAPNSYPEEDDAPQPVRLRYTGSAVQKQIAAHYEGGLETAMRAEDPCYWERVSIRFLADDPFWYEIIESAQLLDTSDQGQIQHIAGRLRSTGQWDLMGSPRSFSVTNWDVWAMAEDETYLYIGGNFDNWGGLGEDHLARYNKITKVWDTALGTASATGVRGLAIAPDGRLYACGTFHTIGGVAAERVAVWDGTTWAPLGLGMDDTTEGVCIGLDGCVYFAGYFHNAGGNPASHVAKWNPTTSAWSALGAGVDDYALICTTAPDGEIYFGGKFLNAGGIGANRIAKWNPATSTWSALGTGTSNIVWAIQITPDGIVFVGGTFTTAGGVTVNGIARWDGREWNSLGVGVNGNVFGISLAKDGMLFAGGDFTQAGGISLCNRIAKWNGSTWSHLDFNLDGTQECMCLLASQYLDPVTGAYDLWVTFSISAILFNFYYNGLATINNDGTERAYPRIIVERNGGTSALLKEIRNETLDQELLFDYSLLDGETLTIDLEFTKRSVISNFFGSRFDAILANSDIGTFVLRSGSNNISSFVDIVGDPTVLVYMLWKDTYKSFD